MSRRHDKKDLHLITGHKYLKNDPYHKLRTLPRMRYLTHLPTDIKASVDTYIQTQPIYANRCWYNSHKLHLHNPKINVEHGYYFPKRISEDKEYKNQKKRWELMYKYLETHNFIDGDTKKLIVYPNDALYPHMKHFRKGKGEFYETDEKPLPKYFFWNEDYQTYLPLHRHSWNSYNGVHFDIMCGFLKEEDYDTNWIYYFNTDYSSNYKNWKMKRLLAIENYINTIGVVGDFNSTRNINTQTTSQRFIKTNWKQSRGYLNG